MKISKEREVAKNTCLKLKYASFTVLFHFCGRTNETLTFEQAEKIDQALGHYLQEPAQKLPVVQTEEQFMNQTVLHCPSCGMNMVIRSRREGSGKFIGCMGYPDCWNAVWFPGSVEAVELSGKFCSEVGDLEKSSFT